MGVGYSAVVDSPCAYFRFYGPLNEHLPAEQRQKDLEKPFFAPGSVKDMIESFGVPHPEVELILANGVVTDFSYIVGDGDRIAVYPGFRAIEVLSNLRPPREGEHRFVLDVHLGRLAAYLRMIGFDATYRNCFSDPELVRISREEQRILLSRDRGLLMHSAVTYGYLLRATDSREQMAEVVRQFDLERSFRPFTRCMACNGMLKPVGKEDVRPLLPDRTLMCHEEFSQCHKCRRIYWKGSHYQRMTQWIADMEAPALQKISPFYRL
jgi:uncharacterized protein with PIN domain